MKTFNLSKIGLCPRIQQQRRQGEPGVTTLRSPCTVQFLRHWVECKTHRHAVVVNRVNK